MSDSYLRLIPVDPSHIPTQEQIDNVLSLLCERHPEVMPKAVTWQAIEFVDQGANFETVSCPCCGYSLDVLWWADEMSRSYEASHFRDRAIMAPCCGCLTDLNDLLYSWPAGFARFVLELPNPEADLSDEDLSLVANALAAQLRKVWAHY